MVTIDQDFKRFIKPKKAGVIFLPAYLSDLQMDNLLTNFVKDKNPDDFIGKVTSLQ